LKQAAVSVERLRNFQLRLEGGQFPQGVSEQMTELARDTLKRFWSGMEDDLNTAQAQAAIFDMVRKANAAIDAGQFRKDDAAALLDVLHKFDQIFAVLKDDETVKMKKILDWAKSENREKDVSNELLQTVDTQQLSDAGIEQRIAEMEQARRSRNFKSSDAIRAELMAAGIVVENTKDGVRWKRK
jgi:cysteinyl-tRNA synthetase